MFFVPPAAVRTSYGGQPRRCRRGVRLVWVIDPRAARATEYRSLTEVRDLGLDDVLEGGNVLPGYRCPLRDILLPRSRRHSKVT